MLTIRSLTKFASAFFIAFVVLPLPARSQENVRAIGAVIAPHELIAAYSCSTYAEAAFLPKVELYAKRILKNVADKRAELKRIIYEYDETVSLMCREVSSIFKIHREEVLDAYALQLPGNKSDIKPFLATQNGSRWAKENVEFLAATAPLIQYYALAKSVAPELLSEPHIDQAANQEAWSTSVGMTAKYERQQLIRLLADKSFERMAPARFNFSSLKSTEARLRREAALLQYKSSFLWFNDNASDLVRMHFNGFDIMRKLGLADVYIRSDQQLQKWMH